MGRSGGRGGGRSGGGRSGGSRSSGRSAFGGSSRSSSRSFSSSRSSSRNFNSGPPRGFSSHHRPIHHGSFGGGFGRGFGRSYVGGLGGGFTSIIAIIVWLVLILGIFSVVAGGYDNDGSYGFTKSTVDRDKLNLHLSDDAGYYTDECGWIRNSTTLERGLKEFYDSTGILPYVYIIDNVEGDYDPSTEKLEAFAEAKYEALFDDEGHALLLFWDYGGAYEYVLMLGYDTMELMDNEACDILFDYLDYYYYYADTEEEFFADAFADAGERMMTVTRSPWYYILRIGAVLVVIFVAYKWWKSRRHKEAERRKRAEEILNSPLEKFGDDGDAIDELERKYEKEI